MEVKGTKGKWYFNREEMKIKGVGDVEGLTVIANVSPKMNFSRGMTTQSYNALLISKAPEMLEMLKIYLSDLNNIIPPSDAQRNRIQDVEQLIKEATEL